LIAGGAAKADDTTLRMQAEVGSETYGILSNQYLDLRAKTVLYQVTVTIEGPDQWSYDETTTVQLAKLDKPLAHTDRNTLHRVAD
jgi:hypothetical protein